MSRSSQINQANLFAVLMGEKRRKPLVRRALVSQLYPIFVQPESVAPVFSFLAGGQLFRPQQIRHDIEPVFSFLSGGVLEDFDPFVNISADIESVTPSMLFLTGGVLEDYDPFVNYEEIPLDFVSPTFSFRTGGFVYDAAIRYDEPPSDFVSPTFSFRSGGSLTG